MAKKKSIKKTAENSASKESSTSFEESFARVEGIVRKLEQGQIGLSESLEDYEKGVKHIQQCYQALDAAERKIEILTGIDKDGNATTESLDTVSSEPSPAAESQKNRSTLFDD